MASGKKVFEVCSVFQLLPSGCLFKWLQDAERCLHVFMAEDTDDCRKEGSGKNEVMAMPKPIQGTHSTQ